jgi:antitoxin (DNA-binding transcriptional repressor) of toxin-antitoxin stability system
MKTIKIRDLRGPAMEESARAGELVGITRDRALIAVVVPMGQAWVESVIEHNFSRVIHNIDRAEAEADEHQPLVGLDDVLEAAGEGKSSTTGGEPVNAEPSSASDRALAKLASSTQHLAAGATQHLAVGAEKAGPALAPLREWLERLSTAMAGADDASGPSITTSTKVGIRDLSATRIEQAAEDGEMLILTNDRALIGVVVPVSQRLVEFLISQNLARVMLNIENAEHSVATKERFASVEEARTATPHSDRTDEYAPDRPPRAPEA